MVVSAARKPGIRARHEYLKGKLLRQTNMLKCAQTFDFRFVAEVLTLESFGEQIGWGTVENPCFTTGATHLHGIFLRLILHSRGTGFSMYTYILCIHICIQNRERRMTKKFVPFNSLRRVLSRVYLPLRQNDMLCVSTHPATKTQR